MLFQVDESALPVRLFGDLTDRGDALCKWGRVSKNDNGAKGVLHVSQVSVGEENNLAIWLYGEKLGLEWHQEHPNYLYVKSPDGPRQGRCEGARGAGS